MQSIGLAGSILGRVNFLGGKWSLVKILMVIIFYHWFVNRVIKAVVCQLRRSWFLQGYPVKLVKWTERRNMTKTNVEIDQPTNQPTNQLVKINKKQLTWPAISNLFFTFCYYKSFVLCYNCYIFVKLYKSRIILSSLQHKTIV